MKTYIIRYSLVLFTLLLTACSEERETGSDPTNQVNVGDPVPALSLTRSDGQAVTSATLDGQVYILNFFDTGCPDCQRELRVLQQVYDKYHERVPVLNVPRSQTKEQVQAYWEKAGLSMPYHIPTDDRLYYKFATSIIPRTYVTNTEGKIQAAFSDQPTAPYETLDELLQQLLANDKKAVNLSLQIRLSAGSTRATNDYYFKNEYTISKLDVYLFHSDTKKFFTKVSTTNMEQFRTEDNTSYDITYIIEKQRIKAGKYDIFAIANYDHAPLDFKDENEFLNMVDSTTYRQGIEANIPEGGPVMTSRATELLDIDLLPWVNRDYTLVINIERVMAKLQIGVSRNTFPLYHNLRKYADLNITNYKFVNLSTRYYLFQHRDNLPTFTQRTEFIMPDNFGDCSDQGDCYVVDPLFYQKLPTTADVNRFRRLYQSWYGTFYTYDFAPMPAADNHGFAYVLENTTFKTSQKNGYSPGIVFKAAVSPVLVYLYDTNRRVLEAEYRPEYWPKAIYLFNYNFYGSIQAVNVASGLTLDELETYSDAQLQNYGIKQCKFNMGVYETYYTYWIRHRNNPSEPMGPMEYGIVRNNFYRMVITGINGLGNSIISPNTLRDNYPNSYLDVSFDMNTP